MNLLLIDLTGALRPKANGYNFHFKITGFEPTDHWYDAFKVPEPKLGKWKKFTGPASGIGEPCDPTT